MTSSLEEYGFSLTHILPYKGITYDSHIFYAVSSEIEIDMKIDESPAASGSGKKGKAGNKTDI